MGRGAQDAGAGGTVRLLVRLPRAVGGRHPGGRVSSPGGNSQLAMTWGSGKRLENKHALGLGGAALTAQCGRGTAAEGLGTAAEGCSQPAPSAQGS